MAALLDGVRVLSLGKMIPGDLATQWLGDLGADVIRVESPPHGDPLRQIPPASPVGPGLYFLTMGRNVRSLALDLGRDEGRVVLHRLVAATDVFLESSRPGLPEAQGYGYETLAAEKPDLIYCSLTGYGQTGPWADLPSHGLNIDAAAGAFRPAQRPDGGPDMPWNGVNGYTPGMAGTCGGALHAALAITAALVRRARTGEGAYLDVSCWDAAVAAPGSVLELTALANGGDGYPAWSPFSSKHNLFLTRDGKLVFLAPIEQKFWVNFCRAVGRDDWADRGDWREGIDRGHSDPGLRAEIEAVLRTRTRDEWMALGAEFDFPVAPYLDLAEVAASPQAEARQTLVEAAHPAYGTVRLVNVPFKVAGAPFEIRHAPAVLGEHTDAVLAEVGYDEAERGRLRRDGIVAGPVVSLSISD